MQDLSHVPSVVLVTGTQGSGKTSIAVRLLFGWEARWRFVFDHCGQWAAKLGRPRQTTLKACGEALARDGLCIFDPLPAYGAANLRQAFAAFCQFTIDASRRLNQGKVLVVEEFQDVCPKGSAQLPYSICEVIHSGRREKLDILALSQTPSGVHPDFRAQVTRLAAFGFSDELSLNWLRGFGFNKADLDELRNLPRFAYLWKPRGLPARKILP